MVAALLSGCSDTKESPSVASTTALAPAPPTTTVADRGPESFSSPTGNIGCYIDTDYVRCDIEQRTWSPPARPGDCEFDYGQGIALTTKGAEFVCAGDTTLGAEEKLPYGASSQRGQFICLSEQSGMTCHDAKTGGGFALSRTSYRIF